MASPYLKRAAAIVGNWKQAEVAKQQEEEERRKSVAVDTSKQPTEEDYQSGINPYLAMNLRLKGESDKIKDLVPQKPASSPFWAGVGDVIKTAGSAFSFLGGKKEGEGFFDKTGQKMQEFGTTLQSEFNEPEKIAALGDFNWADLAEPEFYSQKVLRSLPFALSLIPAGIVGAYAGTAAAGALGLGAFGTTVLGSLGAAGLSRPIESALEAGSTYQEALDRGMSQEEANNAANSTFRKNLSLAGMDAAEFATAFLPTNKIPFLKSSKFLRSGMGTVLKGGVKLGATGAMEATEEILQEKFQREAVGDKFSLSAPQTKEAGVVGAIFGIGLGGAGEVFTNIQRGVIESLPEKAKQSYENYRNANLKKGMSDDAATLQALDKVTVKHKNDVKEAVKVRIEEIRQREQAKVPQPETTEVSPEQQAREAKAQEQLATLKPEVSEAIKNSGVKFEGLQEVGDGKQMILFTDEKTGSTLGMDPETVTEESINKKLETSRKAFGIEPEAPAKPVIEIPPTAEQERISGAAGEERKEVKEGDEVNFEGNVFTIRNILKTKTDTKYNLVGNGKDFWTNEMGLQSNMKETQAEVVRGVVKDGPMSIREVSESTGILEPNIRRILGTGAKEGVFERVDKGVYILSQDGQDTAFVHTGDAVEALPKLAESGTKVDMVFLDIPYKTPAVQGGNRGIKKYDFVTTEDFDKIVKSISKMVRSDDTPVYYMYSKAPSGLKAMLEYNDKMIDAGFIPVAEGDYTKLFKSGQPVTNVRGEKAAPEGIILFNRSGKFTEKEAARNLNFNLVRPPVSGKEGYQTQKPRELARSLILQGTKEGDTVLDPFAGSGVVPEQAVKAGRKAIAVEKNKEAVEKFVKPRVKAAAEEKAKVSKKTKPQEARGEAKKEKPTQVSKKEQKKYPKFADAGGFADYPMHNSDINEGGVADAEFKKQKQISDITKKLKGIEMPELVRMYKELTSSSKLLLKNYPNYLGRFYAIPGNYHIGLNRNLFAKKTIVEEGEKRAETDQEMHDRAAKTMAHELGHLVDFLPDEIMNRGNILGRLLTLSGFRKEFIGDTAVIERRKKVMQELGYRRSQLNKKKYEVTKKRGGQVIKINVKEEVAKLEEELAEISEKLTFRKDIQDELKALTQNWKPFDEAAVPEWFLKYRYSSPELYADFISVLFTRPDLAKQWAPTFLNKWFENLDKKPEFKKAFFELQMLIGGERENLVQKRYEDLLEMFKRSDEIFKTQLIERVSHKNNPWYEFKKQMVYQHQWAIDKYKKNQDFFDKHPDADPRFFMEQYDYLGEKVYARINKNIAPIMTDLKDAGLSWDELSAVLFVERIGKGDTREGVANPLGHTVQSTNELREYIEKTIGNKKQADVLFGAAKRLRKALKYLMLEYDFLYTPEMLEKIKKDDFYAPFNVAYKVFNRLPPGLKHQTGNLNDTNNIANNIVLKYIGIIHSGEKNKISNQTIDMVRRMDGGVQEAEYYIAGQKTVVIDGEKRRLVMKTPKEPDDKNLGLITTMEQGKVKGYYVSKEIADSFKYEPLSQQNLLVKYVFEIPNKYFFKPIFTTINPGFQIVNFLFRDLMTTKKLPGLTWGKLFKYYKEALPSAYKKAIGEYDETVNTMLDKGILIMNNSGKYRFTESVDAREREGIDYILQMAGFDKFEGTSKLETTPGLKQGMKVIDFLQKTGEMFEAIPKIAGYKYLLDHKVFAGDKINEHWVRSNIGSPNFKKISKKHFTLNNVGLFYNAVIRGWERTYETATYKQSKSAFWFHIVKYSVIPAVMMVAAEEGAFGDEVKKMTRKMSEYMKNNYINIPIKISEKISPNKVIFFSIPMAEEDRLFHAMTRIALKGVTGDMQDLKRSAMDIASYTGGQVPGFAPQVELGLGWYTYLTGGNPYDMFRNQTVFTMDEERAGAQIKFPIMLKWTANKTGLIKAELRDRPQNTTLGETTIKNIPIIHRFLRISNFGEYEANQRPKELAGIEEATDNIIEKRKIIAAVNNYWKEKPSNMQAYINKTAVEIYGAKIAKSDYNNLKKTFNKYLVGGLNDANLNSLSSGSTKEKVAVLMDLKDNLSTDEFNKLLQTAVKTKTLSEDVMQAFAQKLKEESAAKAFK